MIGKRLTKSKKELLDRIEKEVDANWDVLSAWEKTFVEDILSNYHKYGDNTFLSDKQVDCLITLSEKLL